MRGYLHGGLLIDFVGQLGPTSKIKLVSFDCLTLALQLVILAVFMERAALKRELVSRSTSGDTTGNTEAVDITTGQDHDSEEQGILRSDPNAMEDIELQPLGSSANQEQGGEIEERDGLLAELSQPQIGNPNVHPFEVFHTGQYVIANLHIIETIRAQRGRYDAASSESSTSSSTSSTAAMAAAIAQRRLGFSLNVGGRTLAGG